MRKLVPQLLLGLSFIALMPLPAQADARRPNFFELLFGVHPRVVPPQPANTPPYKVRRSTNVFQSQDQNQFQDQAQPAHRHRATDVASTADDQADPEFQIPGLGMGTVDYMPPLVQPVFDPTFAGLQVADPQANAVRGLLADKATPIRALEVERRAITAFYKARDFKPVWVGDGRLTPRAEDVLKTLAAAADDGLVAKNYLPEVLANLTSAETDVAGDAGKQARLELSLTAATLRYARHLSGGQFEPNRLSLYNDMKPEAVNVDEALKALADAEHPANYLSSLAPANSQYGILKAALAKVSGSNAKFALINAGPNIKPGMNDPRIPALRDRLAQLGFIAAPDAAGAQNIRFDQDLAIGLMAFQTARKMKPSGLVDGATLKLLNRNDAGEQRDKLIASMERLRWLPSSLGERYVFVNQAAFDVHVMDHDRPVWASRVIVGQPTKQTNAFYNHIQTVVFNPKWGVPPSIIVNEYGPKMRRDPDYLNNHGFIVVDLNGNEIDSHSVDWYHIGPNPKFGIQQLAGGDNALGELKFLFPNAHNIYMHDTPTKNLFNNPVRAESHGCVRVQNPREFAQVLLNWNKDQVVKSLGNKETHAVELQQKVPVYLTYFTAWADDTGTIQYHDDIYGRDAAIIKAMAYDPNAPKSGSAAVIAQGQAQAQVSGGIIQN